MSKCAILALMGCWLAVMADANAVLLLRNNRDAADIPAFDSGTQYRWGKRSLVLKREDIPRSAADIPAFDSGTQYRWGKRSMDDIPAFDSGTQYRWGKRSSDIPAFDSGTQYRWGKRDASYQIKVSNGCRRSYTLVIVRILSSFCMAGKAACKAKAIDEGANSNSPMLTPGAVRTADSRRAECGTSARVTPTPLNPTNNSMSTSKRRWKLFERANSQWWNPQFASVMLESCYWKCSFPQLRDRFRCGLVYLILTELAWLIYHFIDAGDTKDDRLTWHVGLILLIAVTFAILGFTFSTHSYQRFYLPTSFLCMFLICVVSLLAFSLPSAGEQPAISPVGAFVTSIEVVLLLYTVIPLPLYVCVVVGLLYTVLFEVLSLNHKVGTQTIDLAGLKLIMHMSVHLLGVHIYILSQVRHRKTFLKIGQSLIARKDLESETQFKDRMIESVMPRFVADQLLKETTEIRRTSCSAEAGKRLSGGAASTGPGGAGPLANIPGSKAGPTFRPFTMNLMKNVSILFADICGFTRMSSNKTADELVNLLNDLFGRFDRVCGLIGCEKISTLGDCYYAVSGCPVARPDHAKCCVELGQAMIHAIKQFDADRGQDVNMRVGIHTGKVMCGLVGTKLFKFDVFSNDVTFANEMESSGQAGRIHLSESTATFLTDDYQLEPGTDYKGVKTFFVVGRHKGSATPDTSSLPNETQERRSNRTASFKKKLSKKLKALQPTASLPARAGTANESSLRQKLLSARGHKDTLTTVHDGVSCEQYVTTGKRRSASEQAICAALNATSPTHDHPPSSRASALTDPGGGQQNVGGSARQLHHPSMLTSNKQSRHMGNGTGTASASGSLNEQHMSTNNNSLSMLAYRPPSRSSGIIGEAGSDVGSIAALDTITQHHANASLTRFDTDHRDFDRRLCDVIQINYLQTSNFASTSYWIGRDALNTFTMTFREQDIENEYRRHFAVHPLQDAVARDRVEVVAPSNGVVNAGGGSSNESQSRSTAKSYRYSGVVIDVFVAVFMFVLIALVCLIDFDLVQTWPSLPLSLLFGTIVCVTGVTRVLAPLMLDKTIAPILDLWLPRHIYGLLLVALPGLAALVTIWHAPNDKSLTQESLVTAVRFHLLCAYILLVCMFGHVNFSQLACWPKTLQAAVIAILLVCFSQFCVTSTNFCVPPHNVTQFVNQSAHVPLFTGRSPYKWELVLDVTLALILIGFLNYQFEGAFRMAFFGGVQARRDTEQMQAMRDQADWLLSNIIPPHVVQELKTNSKYSESHDMVAVLFATIVNWADMYEETFEGGREFLRVLNEVIGDFDELLNQPEFSQVQKIKTIGPTYMAASGLVPERRRLAPSHNEHLYQLMEFSIALQETLANFNEDLLNFEFEMKIGYNIGPVTAGVIGTTKLYYDIWGDTVNIASRMYSTGLKKHIQVSEHVKQILEDRYDFEFRDRIEVKGIDGGMDVYLLKGRKRTFS